MKYGDLTLGQIEAMVNKLGGMEGVHRLLSGVGEAGIVLVAKSFVTVLIDPAKPFICDMSKKGWKLLEDVKYEAGEVQLELAEFLKPGESSVSGEVMAERAKQMGVNLGQKHAEYLLENQHPIPKEWHQYYLVFSGTVWQVSGGDRRVPYLHWHGERWYLYFDWLGSVWSSRGRLLSVRK